MVLTYRFKKEKLESGEYVARPRILIVVSGSEMSIEVPALIDSGCDVTVIPEGIARAIGLSMEGNETKLYAFRESAEVIESKATITFLGKEPRESIKLPRVPVLIALAKKGMKDEEDITLGVNGIFDAFDITFKRAQNKIVFKKVTKLSKYFFL
ncbi:MAG: retroviral-like aspartic protease family protein [Nanoarchaeota archaeon]|nr:retroviral-like aspartic protease family protein [Nanoarchaeota archaeon]MBU1621955.1 retroviral-like aspartic protease family protein [Nanoarchaeota archaeon]MBU1974185.1 retroviral-like aspartic protease family protein [Nanoarchaeota archaeon]